MYLRHWGMQLRPFEDGHDPQRFVPLESASLTLMKMRYVAVEGLAGLTLTGAAGAGKTELMRMMLGELVQAGWPAAYVANPSGTAENLLATIGHRLGASSLGASPGSDLEAILAEHASMGRRVCIAVDDAHTVRDPEILEQLRMLLNVESDGRKAVTLFLAGQPPLHNLLRRASDFHSHMSLHVALSPLTEEEAKRYVLFHLKVAGCTRGIFTRQAAERIYRYSRGIPRNINHLCDLALLTGYAQGVEKIGPEILDVAAAEIGLSPASQKAGADLPVAPKAPASPLVPNASSAPAAEAPVEEVMDVFASIAAPSEETPADSGDGDVDVMAESRGATPPSNG